MILSSYKYIFYILLPLIKINLIFRIRRNKEDPKRYRERYGISKLKRPKGNLIWIHAASVGEFNSATGLIKYLLKKNNVLVTTSTLTAYKYCKQMFGNKVIHQFAPIDHKPWIVRFLNHWSPNFVIWIESDIWPNTIKSIKEKQIKQVLLNLRISPKSLDKWKIIKKSFSQIINDFDKIFVQSKNDLKLIRKITNRKLNYIGNLKLTAFAKKINRNKLIKIKKDLGSKKIILLASTHQNEEELILEKIAPIINKNSGIKIIIVPRHPERAIDVLNIAKKNISNCSAKLNNLSFSKFKCFVLNSLGEMKIYYNISDIVILGGSFIDMGGHNPIEPAKSKCAILSGSSIYNWRDIFEEMKSKKACIICKSTSEIIKNLNILLKNINSEKKLMNNALNYSNRNQILINNFIRELKPFLVKNNA